ncbi:hypothetical protein [Rhizobium sp. Root1204]|uniref:hypothetical protein n=1 Tax=Rhizobium sp. Root1204 TaxID=1736428 RepID=UPI000A6C3B30|nr:hypothetical protein [Rhizobium sp. Root1204]
MSLITYALKGCEPAATRRPYLESRIFTLITSQCSDASIERTQSLVESARGLRL